MSEKPSPGGSPKKPKGEGFVDPAKRGLEKIAQVTLTSTVSAPPKGADALSVVRKLLYRTDTVEAVTRFKLEGGARSVSGDCTDPIWAEFNATVSGGTHPSQAIGMERLLVRCRACAACRKHRARVWYARAMAEYEATPGRTWFLTFTYRGKAVPHAKYRDLQLFWKRLRKSGLSFRFMAVKEAGERNGRLHWHALVYEVEGPIRKRDFEREWLSRHGFLKAMLATPLKVSYVAGYCSGAEKTKLEVHASVRFGGKRNAASSGTG